MIEDRDSDLPAALGFDDEGASDRQAGDDSALELAAELGDADAFAELLSKQPGRLAEALDLLRRLVAMEPWRTRSLVRLNELALELDIADVQAVTDQLVSTFDTSVPYRCPGVVVPEALWTEDLHGLIDSALSEPMRELLALTWRLCVRTERFTRSLASAGAEARYEVRPGSGPVARCVREASRLLGVEEPRVYLKPGRHPEIQLVPAEPMAIVATTGLGAEPHLRFFVARCVMWARPELAVLTALEPAQAQALIHGLGVLARGQQPQALEPLLAGAAPEEGSRLRELAGGLGAELDHAQLASAAERDELRGALLATGDVNLALRALLLTEQSLRGLRPRVAMQFGEACQRSRAFAELVRFSLSDAYLGVVDRMLQRARAG